MDLPLDCVIFTRNTHILRFILLQKSPHFGMDIKGLYSGKVILVPSKMDPGKKKNFFAQRLV